MRIVIGNLPDDVSEEGIRDALSAFAPVDTIKLIKESGTPSAIIETAMARGQAKRWRGASMDGSRSSPAGLRDGDATGSNTNRGAWYPG